MDFLHLVNPQPPVPCMSMYQFSNIAIDRGQESVPLTICKSKKIRLLKENSNQMWLLNEKYV